MSDVTTPTAAEIEELLRLAEKATPRPWQMHCGYDLSGYPCFFVHGLSGQQKYDMPMLDATTSYIAYACNLAPRLAATLAEQDAKLAGALRRAMAATEERDEARADRDLWKAKCEATFQECVSATKEAQALHAAIATHHAQKADDRCIEDDDRLYAAAGLPPCDRRVGDKAAMLRNCERFIDRRCEGGGWPTYAELESRLAAAALERDRLSASLRTVMALREADAAKLAAALGVEDTGILDLVDLAAKVKSERDRYRAALQEAIAWIDNNGEHTVGCHLDEKPNESCDCGYWQVLALCSGSGRGVGRRPPHQPVQAGERG